MSVHISYLVSSYLVTFAKKIVFYPAFVIQPCHTVLARKNQQVFLFNVGAGRPSKKSSLSILRTVLII